MTRTNQTERPWGVTLLAVIEFLGAAGSLGLAVMLWTGFDPGTWPLRTEALMNALTGAGAWTGVFLFAFGVFQLVAGTGMWKLREWGRLITFLYLAGGFVALGGLTLVAALRAEWFTALLGAGKGTVFVLLLFYLSRQEVRQAFRPA